MTDEQWAELEPFVTEEAEKRWALQNYDIAGRPSDYRKAIELDVAHERARIEHGVAKSALENAKNRILKLHPGFGQQGMPFNVGKQS